MSGFASGTDVPISKSRLEIEAMLQRNGATGIVSAWDGDTGRHFLEFKIPVLDAVRVVRVEVPMPSIEDPEIRYTPTGKRRESSAAQRSWEQVCKQRWRQMKLILHAKLEAIRVGISTVEREFLADLVMPDGRTVGQHALPQLPHALESGSPLALGNDS